MAFLSLVLAAAAIGGMPDLPGAERDVQVIAAPALQAYAAEVHGALRLAEGRVPALSVAAPDRLMARFCHGVGLAEVDIALTSRAPTPAGLAVCRAQGVTIRKTVVGFQAVALAAGPDGPSFDLTREEIFRALAKDVPVGANEQLVPNPAVTWADIDQDLPRQPIAYTVPAGSLAEEALKELLLAPGAMTFSSLKALRDKDGAAFARIAEALRADVRLPAQEGLSAFFEANPSALAAMDFKSAEAAGGRLVRVAGVAPAAGTIASGAYAGARPILVLAKGEHFAFVPDLAAVVEGLAEDRGAQAAHGIMAVGSR